MNLKRATSPTRTVRIALAAVLAVVLALLGFSRLRGHEEPPTVEDQTAAATGESSGNATTNGSVQSSGGDPVGPAARPASGATRGRQGSSNAKGSQSTETLPEGTIPRGFEIAFYRGCCWDQSGIYLMNADGSDLRKLVAGTEPGWSPDGKFIAFTNNYYRPEILLMNSDGSGSRNLGTMGSSPSWSPDGGRMAFNRECPNDNLGSADPADSLGPECGIGVVARDGTGVRHLGNGIWPDWGPDGRIIFTDGMPREPCYYRYDGYTSPFVGSECELPVWVMNPDGSSRTRLPIDRAIRPTWSRDGRRIAYHTETDGVFIANSNGTGIAKVAPAGYRESSWSPDALWLALVRYTPDNRDSIYVRSIDGSAERRLTNSNYDLFPAFSPRP